MKPDRLLTILSLGSNLPKRDFRGTSVGKRRRGQTLSMRPACAGPTLHLRLLVDSKMKWAFLGPGFNRKRQTESVTFGV